MVEQPFAKMIDDVIFKCFLVWAPAHLRAEVTRNHRDRLFQTKFAERFKWFDGIGVKFTAIIDVALAGAAQKIVSHFPLPKFHHPRHAGEKTVATNVKSVAFIFISTRNPAHPVSLFKNHHRYAPRCKFGCGGQSCRTGADNHDWFLIHQDRKSTRLNSSHSSISYT